MLTWTATKKLVTETLCSLLLSHPCASPVSTLAPETTDHLGIEFMGKQSFLASALAKTGLSVYLSINLSSIYLSIYLANIFHTHMSDYVPLHGACINDILTFLWNARCQSALYCTWFTYAPSLSLSFLSLLLSLTIANKVSIQNTNVLQSPWKQWEQRSRQGTVRRFFVTSPLLPNALVINACV